MQVMLVNTVHLGQIPKHLHDGKLDADQAGECSARWMHVSWLFNYMMELNNNNNK